MAALNPITRVILQYADGYYSITWDATCGVVILPGMGSGSAVHNGVTYTFNAADPTATVPNAATSADLASALLAPVTVVQPGGDLAAAINTAGPDGLVELAPGDYPAFTVPTGT